MKISITQTALLFLVGFVLATSSQAQTILPIPQPAPYRPVWNQYLPINVFHTPGPRYYRSPVTIGRIDNSYQPSQMGFRQSGGIGTSIQSSRVMPILPTDIGSLASPQIEHVIVNASDLSFQSVPAINVVDSWTNSNSVDLAIEPLNTNDQVSQHSSTNLLIDPGTGPAQPSQVTYEEPLAGFIEGEVIVEDQVQNEIPTDVEPNSLADSEVEQELTIEPQVDIPATSKDSTNDQTAEISPSQKEAIKDELERQILLAIKQKQEDNTSAIELDKIKKQMDQLQDANTKPESDVRIIEERTEKSPLAKPHSEVMTLAKLAEQKRLERDQNATQDKGPKIKAQQRLETLKSEMESQMLRSVEKIRTRYQKKIDRVAKLNNSTEKAQKLENEMNVQVEKMKNRIVNRFKQRIESAKRETAQ